MIDAQPLTDAELSVLCRVNGSIDTMACCWRCFPEDELELRTEEDWKQEPCATCIAARMPDDNISRLLATIEHDRRLIAILRAHRIDAEYLWAATHGLLDKMDPKDYKATGEAKRKEVDKLIAIALGKGES